MNIQILSDIHLEFEDFEIDYSNSDVVVLAGDIHLADKGIKWAVDTITDIPVIYVLGNHEYYNQAYPKIIRKIKKLIQGTNIQVLENDCIEIESVKFYGCTLWTDFELFGNPRVAGYECQQKMTDFKKIRKEPKYSKIRSLDIASINKKSVNWLVSEFDQKSEKTIIVTHHAPSMQSVPEKNKNDIVSAAYASNLDWLVEKLSPKFWIHGHIHESSDYTMGSTRVVCNPRGYPGERNDHFNHHCIVSV
jgi:Icc-related predicted phosphoesterase